MRKVKLQMQVSLDGYVAGPNGEMDWMVWNWDDELKNYVDQITQTVDCILLGRHLAEGFIPHWANAAANPTPEEGDFARKMTETPKVVFSRTLENSPWPQTVLAGDDLRGELARLKALDGGDIIVYGGAKLVSGLICEGLIDEYNLFVNPAILGAGMPIFRERAERQALDLVEARAFACGIVGMRYQPKS
ncbi:MAG: dihydrofolate reductase family protein [Saprospiraceae bacterium]|nr:dihydrofolate reductase family protein [Saprospiraceae bacterium]